MAPITTIADVEAFTGVNYDAAQEARLTVLLPLAERYVKRRAGRIFYDATDPEADASQDWRTVVSMVVERMLAAEDPEARAAVVGPFASERLGDYSYTLKATADQALDADAQIADIIAAYRTITLPGMLVNGPTRVAAVVVDADVSRGLP